MKQAEPKLEGPYAPTWDKRRRLVFAMLAYLAVLFPLVVLFAPERKATDIALWGMIGLAAFTVTYYLIGPSWQAWILARALARITLAQNADSSPPPPEDPQEGVVK